MKNKQILLFKIILILIIHSCKEVKEGADSAFDGIEHVNGQDIEAESNARDERDDYQIHYKPIFKENAQLIDGVFENEIKSLNEAVDSAFSLSKNSKVLLNQHSLESINNLIEQKLYFFKPLDSTLFSNSELSMKGIEYKANIVDYSMANYLLKDIIVSTGAIIFNLRNIEVINEGTGSENLKKTIKQIYIDWLKLMSLKDEANKKCKDEPKRYKFLKSLTSDYFSFLNKINNCCYKNGPPKDAFDHDEKAITHLKSLSENSDIDNFKKHYESLLENSIRDFNEMAKKLLKDAIANNDNPYLLQQKGILKYRDAHYDKLKLNETIIFKNK